MKLLRKTLKKTMISYCFFSMTTTFGTIGLKYDCPDQFIGEVVKTFDPEADSSAGSFQAQAEKNAGINKEKDKQKYKEEKLKYTKVKVSLKVLEPLSNSVIKDQLKTFEILKYSAGKFKLGEKYRIDMRNKWLCRISKFSSTKQGHHAHHHTHNI